MQSIGDWRVVGTPDDIERVVERHSVDRLVVGMSDRRGRLPVRALLRSKLRGIRVEDVNTVYERLTGKLLVEDLRPSWLIFSDDYCASRWTRQSKRAFDVALALVGLVRRDAVRRPDGDGGLARIRLARSLSPGPGRRERTDLHAEQVPIDAEGRRAGHAGLGERGGRARDAGRRFIRQTRLDELPQLWNVLRGDMSFVGPRPERPFFVNQLAEQIPFYEQRHAVKPGLTGWAQVKYRYGASFEDSLEKLRYDLYYVKHLSIPFDLTILFDTVKVVLFAKGAR